MRLVIPMIAAAAITPFLMIADARAETCTSQDFATAVDGSGASLRTLTLEAQPKLQERLSRYKTAYKLTDDAYENAALDAIQDEKLAALDQKSSELLLTVDSLGRVPAGGTPDCAKLDQVKAAAAELNAVVKVKSEYMLRRLDEKIAAAEKTPAPEKAAAAPVVAEPQSPQQASPKPAKPPTPPAQTAKPASPAPDRDWAARTQRNDAYSPPVLAMREPNGAPFVPVPQKDGFTIEEIRDATQGFFGTVSTNLAAVIEHAFNELGRPTAYVLGSEGGGAFLAGLRFGKGTLYMRSHSETYNVFWHGPSVGTDFGASGSRTLFLIYGLQDAGSIFRYFAGIDGSAYFVGGVGLTVLKGGPVTMAPIRSGVGVRIGANIGYVRFTNAPTWNPF